MARSKKNILNNAEISNRNEEKEINIMNKKDKEEETKVTKIDNFVAPFVSQDSLNDVKEPFDITKVEGVKLYYGLYYHKNIEERLEPFINRLANHFNQE